jgi:hypothetical protein
VPLASHKLIRMTALLAILGALVLDLASRSGLFGQETQASQVPAGAWANGCPAREAPTVARLSPGSLAELGSGVRQVMLGRHGHLYEFGAAASEDAWSDDPPQRGQVLLPQAARVPGAYEMRWWATNGDDVVADAFAFTHSSQARAFFALASSPRCRPHAKERSASSPPGARDLGWLNPDNAFQQDVYLLRGHIVFRVVDVRHGSDTTPDAAQQRLAFSIVNRLACALPEAGCRVALLSLLPRV